MGDRYAPQVGILGAIGRAFVNGATTGLSNNISAAGNATLPLDPGVSTALDWTARYRENLARQEALDAAAEQQHGNTWWASNAAGQMANPVYNEVLPKIAARMANGIVSHGELLQPAFGILGATLSQQGTVRDPKPDPRAAFDYARRMLPPLF